MNIGARRPPPRKITLNVSFNADVQLKKSENPWKPGMKRSDVRVEDPEAQNTQVGLSTHTCMYTNTEKIHKRGVFQTSAPWLFA